MGKIKIIPMSDGACRVCATVHGRDEPHEKDSLYYLNWFRKKYKRLPTWEDAIRHCDMKTKKKMRQKLAKKGEL